MEALRSLTIDMMEQGNHITEECRISGRQTSR